MVEGFTAGPGVCVCRWCCLGVGFRAPGRPIMSGQSIHYYRLWETVWERKWKRPHLVRISAAAQSSTLKSNERVLCYNHNTLSEFNFRNRSFKLSIHSFPTNSFHRCVQSVETVEPVDCKPLSPPQPCIIVKSCAGVFSTRADPITVLNLQAWSGLGGKHLRSQTRNLFPTKSSGQVIWASHLTESKQNGTP